MAKELFKSNTNLQPMLLTYYIVSVILFLASLLPFISHQHWFFRIFEFGKIQVLVLQLTTIAFGITLIGNKNTFFWVTILFHIVLIISHVIILFPYTSLYQKDKQEKFSNHSQTVSIISVNVYQFNKRYNELINLVFEVQPDILLTMESNQDWDNALSKIENDYPNFKKVPLENTYGIHFYTKLNVKSIKVNYLISNDIPSIEATLITNEGIEFTFFGVHPPPPSPTEEDTSKERDGELLSIGKKVVETKGAVIVAGDFNNVAWAKSSVLFRKTSQLIDPRIGRGFVSTYHAKYRFLRFPIDLFFHSTDIYIEEFKTLLNIGSDHLPLFCSFHINKLEKKVQEEEVETLEEGDEKEVEEMIGKGIQENDNRPEVAEE